MNIIQVTRLLDSRDHRLSGQVTDEMHAVTSEHHGRKQFGFVTNVVWQSNRVDSFGQLESGDYPATVCLANELPTHVGVRPTSPQGRQAKRSGCSSCSSSSSCSSTSSSSTSSSSSYASSTSSTSSFSTSSSPHLSFPPPLHPPLTPLHIPPPVLYSLLHLHILLLL